MQVVAVADVAPAAACANAAHAGQSSSARPSGSRRPRRIARCRHGRWRAAGRPSPWTPGSTTTSSGSCAGTACASPRRARPATTPTATARRWTSCLRSARPRATGTPRPAVWRTSSDGHRRCGSSGARPACPLKPAIQWVGYDGYPSHGSPRTCTGAVRPHPRVLGLRLLRLERTRRAVLMGHGVPRPDRGPGERLTPAPAFGSEPRLSRVEKAAVPDMPQWRVNALRAFGTDRC